MLWQPAGQEGPKCHLRKAVTFPSCDLQTVFHTVSSVSSLPWRPGQARDAPFEAPLASHSSVLGGRVLQPRAALGSEGFIFS